MCSVLIKVIMAACLILVTNCDCTKGASSMVTRIVVPGTSGHLSVNSGIVTISSTPYQIKMVQCAGPPSPTLALVANLGAGLYVSYSSAFTPQLVANQNKIEHLYSFGSQHDYINIGTPNSKYLKPYGSLVFYDSAFNWQILPLPEFCSSSGVHRRNADSQLSFYNAEGNKVDVISQADEQSRSILRDQFDLQIYLYRLYTGFDSQGRYKWVRSVVLRKGNTDWYLAPDSDMNSGVIPLCQKFEFDRRKTEILYQQLLFRKFNDAIMSNRSIFRTANIQDAKFADRRWFQVEPLANGRARLRPVFDLDKYVAVLSRGPNNNTLVITTYREDARQNLLFEFELRTAVCKTGRKPNFPCNKPGIAEVCPYPGEVEDTNLRPNNVIPRLHPACYNVNGLNGNNMDNLISL